MATLPTSRIGTLLAPFYPDASESLLQQLSLYLDLLMKWNARTNLTAVREPEAIVTRHFGESLFLARHLPPCQTLLDLGSGAGFPGVPAQLSRPEIQVTLAESQQKKAAFLREVVRELDLRTEIWAARAEDIPDTRRFDVVCLRAVDNPELALKLACKLARDQGWVAHLTSRELMAEESGISVPSLKRSVLHMFHVEHS